MAPVSTYFPNYPIALLFDGKATWRAWIVFQDNLSLLTMAWGNWCAGILFYLGLPLLPKQKALSSEARDTHSHASDSIPDMEYSTSLNLSPLTFRIQPMQIYIRYPFPGKATPYTFISFSRICSSYSAISRSPTCAKP